MSVSIKTLTFNAFQENTYIVICDDTKEAVIVDPGVSTKTEEVQLLNAITQLGATPTAVWLTHAHIDHVLGLRWICEHYRLPFYQSEADAATLRSVPVYAPMYGIPHFALPDAPGQIVQAGDSLFIGQTSFEVRLAPGHAPGHLVFYNPTLGVLAGDCLFAGSIGRTDLPGGDFDVLERSIREQLYTLPDETTVYPGHGLTTTIGREKKFNPFVRV